MVIAIITTISLINTYLWFKVGLEVGAKRERESVHRSNDTQSMLLKMIKGEVKTDLMTENRGN